MCLESLSPKPLSSQPGSAAPALSSTNTSGRSTAAPFQRLPIDMLVRAISRAGAPTRLAILGTRGMASAAAPETPQLEFGRAMVWGRGSLGLRPSDGLQRQLDNLAVTALKPTVLNTLTDTRIEQVSYCRQCTSMYLGH